MFSGIVETLGTVEQVIAQPPGIRLAVRSALVASDAKIGDSVAVNGCCLTIVSLNDDVLEFDAGAETLSRTNLGRLDRGSNVNLERSMKLGDRIGGHIVSGHIDAVAHLDQRNDDQDWATFWFRMNAALGSQMISKGSITVDGVSLTLVDVEPERFSVALIPHTLNATTLGRLQPGDPVNLETDMLAKYVEKQMQLRGNMPA